MEVTGECVWHPRLSVKNSASLHVTRTHRASDSKSLVHIRIFFFSLSPRTCFAILYISRHLHRVPRDLISDTLRMVSCITRLQPHPSPTGNGGNVAELISFSTPSFPFLPPLTFFTLALRDGWDQVLKTRFIYFQKNELRGNETLG